MPLIFRILNHFKSCKICGKKYCARQFLIVFTVRRDIEMPTEERSETNSSSRCNHTKGVLYRDIENLGNRVSVDM